MDKRRLLKLLFSSMFILFLLFLAYKFKPALDMPAPVQAEKARRAKGTVSAKGFRYAQEAGGKVEYVVTATTVTESPEGLRLLSDPLLTIPDQGKAWAKQGSFDPATKTLRIWEDAHISHKAGWVANSTGFRLTPEGEIVSEGAVTLEKAELRGSAELMRYDKNRQVAHLEGKAHLEQGPSSLDCTRIYVDLQSHSGQLVGPVTLVSAQGTVKAPDGKLTLSQDNRLENLSLGTPCAGEGPKASFTARYLNADVAADGKLSALHLVQDAVVTVPGPQPSTLRTRLVHFFPLHDENWRWEAPEALAVEKDTGRTTASAGRGTLGDEAFMTAELAGPVKGKERTGTFLGDRAVLKGGDWTLIGHAEANRPGDSVRAESITWRKDGSTLARGRVTGLHKAAGQADLAYEADSAAAASGAGYPAVLEGHVKAHRGEGDLVASKVTLLDEETTLAEGDAKGVFQSKDGTQTVKADRLRYLGKERLARAEGNARAEGKDYWVTASEILLRMDENSRPKNYEAKGSAKFDGPTYKGEGDMLTYDPASQRGEVRGEGRSAVVVEKSPYRRIAGPVVIYAPDHFEVLPAGQLARRGSLEGLPAPAGKAGTPQKPGAQEKAPEKVKSPEKKADGT